MFSKTVALLMFVSIISAGTLFAGIASAKAAQDATNAAAIANAPSAMNVIATTECDPCSASITVVNATRWTVYYYANGEYVGFLYPGHYYTFHVPAGYVTLQARADFTDAPPVFWNSGQLYRQSGSTYTWRLVP